MSSLSPLATARTVAGFDVELRNRWHDGGQVRLILHDVFGIDQGDVALGAKPARNVDGAVNVFRRRCGPDIGLVSRTAAGFLLVAFQLVAAEMPSLPMRLPA